MATSCLIAKLVITTKTALENLMTVKTTKHDETHPAIDKTKRRLDSALFEPKRWLGNSVHDRLAKSRRSGLQYLHKALEVMHPVCLSVIASTRMPAETLGGISHQWEWDCSAECRAKQERYRCFGNNSSQLSSKTMSLDQGHTPVVVSLWRS